MFPIPIHNQDGNGRTDGLAMPHTGEELRGIGFNFHAPAAPVAALTSLQLAIHIVKIDPQPRGQSLQDGHQALTMRLPGGLETQHISHFDADGVGRLNLWILANSARTVKNLRLAPPADSTREHSIPHPTRSEFCALPQAF